MSERERCPNIVECGADYGVSLDVKHMQWQCGVCLTRGPLDDESGEKWDDWSREVWGARELIEKLKCDRDEWKQVSGRHQWEIARLEKVLHGARDREHELDLVIGEKQATIDARDEEIERLRNAISGRHTTTGGLR